MRARDDLTIAELRMRGHGAGGAVPVDVTIWRVSQWRDGKCIWWGSFRTEADAQAAEGLPAEGLPAGAPPVAPEK